MSTATAVEQPTVITWMDRDRRRGPRAARPPDAARRRDRRRGPRDQHEARLRGRRRGAGRPGRGLAARAGCSSSPARRWSPRSAARAARCGARRFRARGPGARRRADVRRRRSWRGAGRRRSRRSRPRRRGAGRQDDGRCARARRSTALRDALADGATAGGRRGRGRRGAEEGARATVPLQARKGRASYLGERSVGHQDPGATSTALIVRLSSARSPRGRLMTGACCAGCPLRRAWRPVPPGCSAPPAAGPAATRAPSASGGPAGARRPRGAARELEGSPRGCAPTAETTRPRSSTPAR